MLTGPRDLASRMQSESDVAFSRETFTLPLAEARLKAREILRQFPQGDYMTTVQHWRQLSDGQIEFSMGYLRKAD